MDEVQCRWSLTSKIEKKKRSVKVIYELKTVTNSNSIFFKIRDFFFIVDRSWTGELENLKHLNKPYKFISSQIKN